MLTEKTGRSVDTLGVVSDGRWKAKMPWKASSPMDERAKFVLEKQRDELNMAELCRRYGISRQTGYKWLERYADGGLGAMGDRSHAPMARPHAMGEEMREA